MPLISANELTIGYRGPPLLDGVSFQIETGQRIGLLGRNGAGKTTLMRILSAEIEPDHGQLDIAPETRLALLPQGIPQTLQGTIADIVADGQLGMDREEWKKQHELETILTRMTLDGPARFERLSSGMKRRVLLARALVSSPDVLLLDEPTNHLDLQAIAWLESFLWKWHTTLIFVTHDRMFLRKLANRILEIDRGQLFDWSCDYDTFVKRKEAALAAEEKQQALFDKKLAREETWIRQGIKARRTRNEGRVRALKKMRAARAERRTQTGQVNLSIHSGQKSGNLVIKADKISFAFAEQPIVRDFSTSIMRGDKVGVIGPNGAGKTTLLKILLGKLNPSSGHLRLGTNLRIAYFDQVRNQLNEEQTVQENVGDGYDTIQIGDRKQHVIGYLQNFLFSPEQARMPVRFLSGGERSRVLLARLFAKSANVIVLDEPTNDLDLETLELLEAQLVEYPGTVLLVSHDREFLNNVVTSTIVFESDRVREYVGGYDDWLRQHQPENAQPSGTTSTATKTKTDTNRNANTRRQGLSYRQQQELASLPNEIEQLETQIADLHDRMGQAEFYQQAGEQVAAATKQLQQLEQQLQSRYQRWEELEAIATA